jgi:hypothetical protein
MSLLDYSTIPTGRPPLGRWDTGATEPTEAVHSTGAAEQSGRGGAGATNECVRVTTCQQGRVAAVPLESVRYESGSGG